MEIRVTRSEFLGELAPMQGIVERKTTIPVLSHLLLTARGDKLHLAATDLDVSLTSWCEADIKREGGIAVQAKKLVEIIRSLTGEEVLLVQEEPRVLYHPGRQVALQDPRPGAGRLPDPPQRRGGAPGRHPLRRVPPDGRQDPLRRLGRGIPLPVERRPPEAQGRLDGDGGDRRPPAGSGRGWPRERQRRGFRPGAAQGPPGAAALRGGRQALLRPRRASPLLRPRTAGADLPHPRGDLPRLRAGHRQGQRQEGDVRPQEPGRRRPARRADDRRPGARRAPAVRDPTRW